MCYPDPIQGEWFVESSLAERLEVSNLRLFFVSTEINLLNLTNLFSINNPEISGHKSIWREFSATQQAHDYASGQEL